MPPSQPDSDATAMIIVAPNAPAPVPWKVSQPTTGCTVPAARTMKTEMNAQTAKMVTIEYSSSATTIWMRALSRMPRTAVSVRNEPISTIAIAAPHLLLGDNPSSASTLGPIVMTSMRTNSVNATSISQPTRNPTYGLNARETHS